MARHKRQVIPPGNRGRHMNGTVVQWGDFPAIRFGEWIQVQDKFGWFSVPADVGDSYHEIADYCALDDGNEVEVIDFRARVGFGCRFVDKNGDNNKCWEVFHTLAQAENHLYAKIQEKPEWADVISDVGEVAMDEARILGYQGE